MRWRVIVLGIAPGLGTLAYCVLDDERALDSDVFHGPKRREMPVARRMRPLELLLPVVWERFSPAVLVLGPPTSSKEPDELVELVRVLLRALAAAVDVPVVQLDRDEIWRRLKVRNAADLGRKVSRRLNGGVPKDKRLLLAAAAALAHVAAPDGTGPGCFT